MVENIRAVSVSEYNAVRKWIVSMVLELINKLPRGDLPRDALFLLVLAIKNKKGEKRLTLRS